jgi:hypothetical protein
VDLFDGVEGRGGVTSQQAREPGREPGPHHHVARALTGLGIELQQRPDVPLLPSHRHDVDAVLERRLGQGSDVSRHGEDHDVVALHRTL